MNRQQQEQAAFNMLFDDVKEVKEKVDNIFFKLKNMSHNRMQNQEVLDFLQKQE